MYKFKCKSYVLFALFHFALINWCFSQNYLNETARWKQSFYYNGMTNSTSCISDRYFDGDTLIEGKKYFLLFYNDECIFTSFTFDSLGNPIVTKDTTNTISFITFIREENKRIYTRAFLDAEVLRYNFDVPDNSPIDSIVKFNACVSTGSVSILNHDTVCIGNIKRKRWKVSMSPYPLAQSIIEGVGPSSGFLAPVCRNGCPECSYYLLSFTLNGDTLYKGNCITTGYHTNKIAELSLYPNPFTESLTVKASTIVNHYTIENLNGTLIIEDKVGKENFVVENKNLNSGLYILKLYFDDEVLVRKILKL